MEEQPSIFKAYDIRGVYGEELDEGIAYLVGRAVVTFLKVDTVLVGRDMRTSSVSLRDALIRGIQDQGADVIDIGLCSTSMFYWAAQDYPAGIMVTASHNPAKYNGFKICKLGSVPIGEISGMKDIAEIVLNIDFPKSLRQGSYKEINVLDEFIAFNTSFIKTTRKFKIVVDAGNGMGGLVYGALMKHLPSNITLIPMFFELDGTFPNHVPNPMEPENCELLMKRVISEKADLGVAIDGDEDRVFFIDEKGGYLRADHTTALVAQQVLMDSPGATILYDLRQSRIVPEVIEAAGGKAIMEHAGSAFVKLAMRPKNAAFGGENSGHFFNPEQHDTENTIIVFFKLLNFLSARNLTLSQAVEPLNKYHKIKETNFTVANANEIIKRLDAEYCSGANSVLRIDGVRIDFEDWWFNVRSSNTEPVLRLNLEAIAPEMMHEKFEELKKKIVG